MDWVAIVLSALLVLGVAFAVVAWRRYRRAIEALQVFRRRFPGCCSACGGDGVSGEIETNGKCWDCQGTGHTHEGPCAWPEVC